MKSGPIDDPTGLPLERGCFGSNERTPEVGSTECTIAVPNLSRMSHRRAV